jgi:putative ABC transport system permease protein
MNSTMWKIALRTLARDKSYALINVVGLAIAIACCLLLGEYLHSELTYDQSHENYKRIFRIANEFEINGKTDRFARTSTMLGPMLKEENSDVQEYVRFLGGGSSRNFLQHGNDGYYWRDTYVVDTNVFDVFTHKILYGDPKHALDAPNAIAISHSVARHYFGERNPIGETLTSDGNDAQVTLVFEDLPENTHLRYDALFSANLGMMSAPNDENIRRQLLFGIQVYTYLLMRPGYDASKWGDVSSSFFERNMKTFGDRINAKWHSWLQPLADIHLNSDVSADLPTGNRYYLYGFVAVAVFTLLVACINYMNLATARAAKRAKEVGMRKILGSSRSALIVQFLAESLVLAVVAVLLGLLLAKLAIAFTPINQLFGRTLSLSFTQMPQIYLWLVGLAALVGIGAGIYPAFYLSAAVPVTALVGGAQGGGRSSGLRESLVFVQFLISVTVIACTLVMAAQMRYISSMSLGFERENRVNVTLRGSDTILSADAIKTQLMSNSNVLGVSWATSPMGGRFGLSGFGLETNQGTIEMTTVNNMGVGPDFINVMGLKLIAGRAPADDVASAAGGEAANGAAAGRPGPPPIHEIVVNEALVRALHWEEPIGKRFELGQGPQAQKGTVVGVVKDFNFNSVHEGVGPFAIFRQVEDFSRIPPVLRLHEERTMVLNIAGHDVPGTLRFVGDTLRKFDGMHPFEFEFVDDSLDRLYVADTRLTRLIAIFAGLCIAIACLGLFGLASFMAAQRTREIGVRKVFGARTGQIISLLAHRIVYLVLGAAAVASVLSYLVMKAWLENFAFRAGINPLIFVAAALAGLGIAYVTVALQSMKAARAHPVNSLRYE